MVGVASAAELRCIAELEAEHYGGEQAVALYRLEAWYEANPNGFVVMREKGRVVGHVTMLPLKPAMLGALIDGTKREKDIERDDIFAPCDRASVRGIYIESLIVQPIQLFGAFIMSFNRHVVRLAVPRHVDAIYAYPVTAAGRLVIANLHFQRLGPSLYAAKYRTLARQTAWLRARIARAIPPHGRADLSFTAKRCGS
ncbi:MAG TPA: hypothetical protein VJU79_00045 [Candidatus Dormibacteraeota bacterium]|nr:hypothetical protein [Candidatus Dormibacteraeota bacterium]